MQGEDDVAERNDDDEGFEPVRAAGVERAEAVVAVREDVDHQLDGEDCGQGRVKRR